MIFEPVLSIIMPAYNAQEYLPLTMNSIVSQVTRYPFEVIVVNDGSTDGTQSLLESYQEKYPFVSAITIKNSGPSNARNVGIEAASGKYILFIDSDDTLVENTLETVISMTEKSQTDLLIFGFQIINEQTNRDFSYYYDTVTLTSSEQFGTHLVPLYQKNMLNQIWNKVYKRTLLIEHQIKFLPFHYGEDRLFVFDVLCHINSLEVTSQQFYNYYMRANESLVSKYYADKFKVCTLIDQKIRSLSEQFHAQNADTTKTLNYMYVKSMISCMTNLYGKSCPLSHSEKRQSIADVLAQKQVMNALVDMPASCNRMTLLMAKIFASKNITLIYLTMFLSTKMIRFAPTLFIKAKHADNFETKKST